MSGRKPTTFLLALLMLVPLLAGPASLAQENRRAAAFGIEVRQGRKAMPGVEVRMESEGPVRGTSPEAQVTDAEGRAEFWWLTPGIWRVDLLMDGEVAYFLTVRIDPGRRAEEMGSPARDVDAPDLRWKFFRPKGEPPPPPPPPSRAEPEPEPPPPTAPPPTATDGDLPAGDEAAEGEERPPAEPMAEPEAVPSTETPPATEAAPAQPEPTPEPAAPEPATPEPATPEPAVEEPVAPEPVTPEPATREPAVEEPATSEPATPEPVAPEPAVEEPEAAEPVTPEPATPEPAGEPPAESVTPPPMIPDPTPPPTDDPTDEEPEMAVEPEEARPAPPEQTPPPPMIPEPTPPPTGDLSGEESAVEEPPTPAPVPQPVPAEDAEEPADDLPVPPAAEPEPVAAAPVEPAPMAAPRFTAGSGAGGDCPECKASESAVSLERTVPPGDPGSGATCGPDMARAALVAARRLASRGQGLGPGMPLDGDELSRFTGSDASCQVMGVVLPPGVRYRGYTYSVAAGGDVGGACYLPRACPVAGAVWTSRPVIEELENGARMVYGVFRNASAVPLRAKLQVFYAGE